MIASGSIDGSEYCTSRVATVLTQSVEPGSGTISTLKPACANQPILVAIANGATADEMVRAHQPTFTVVCACAAPALIRAIAIAIFFICRLPSLPFVALPPSRARPRTARDGGCRR